MIAGMHVFTRTCRIVPGHAGEALDRAIAVAGVASEATGVAVSPWINVYGAPPEAIVFATGVDSPAALAKALNALDGCDAAPVFGSPPLDVVGEVVARAGECGRASFADIATVADGAARTWAVEAGTEIARRTGLRTAVVREVRGRDTALRLVTLAGS